MSVIWNLPKVSVRSLNKVEEHRPTALITSPESWLPLGSVLRLPLVVQAEPSDISPAFLIKMAQQIPAQVEVIYCVGTGVPLTAAKVIASAKKLPLVVVPDALDSDELVEAHITLPAEGLLNQIDTGPATELIIDWEVIQAAPKHKRGAAIVDILAITTALLDWRYATRLGKNAPTQKFSPWGANVAANLASQAIKSAKDIGEGNIDGLRTLLDLMMVSVQLASQLGHDRHQEGMEHYFAFSMENQGVHAAHSDLVGAGILFSSALHEQDPTALREALTYAGVNVDKLRISDIRLAINELPAFCVTNALPYARSHDLDPLSQAVNHALELAGILHVERVEEYMDDESTAIKGIPVGNNEDSTLIAGVNMGDSVADTATLADTDQYVTPSVDEAHPPVENFVPQEVGDASMDADTQIMPKPEEWTPSSATPMSPPALMTPPPSMVNPYSTPNVDDDSAG